MIGKTIEVRKLSKEAIGDLLINNFHKGTGTMIWRREVCQRKGKCEPCKVPETRAIADDGTYEHRENSVGMVMWGKDFCKPKR